MADISSKSDAQSVRSKESHGSEASNAHSAASKVASNGKHPAQETADDAREDGSPDRSGTLLTKVKTLTEAVKERTLTLRAARPLRFARPTTYRVFFRSRDDGAVGTPDRKYAVLYRSRDVRFGRNVIAISRSAVKDPRSEQSDVSAPLFSWRFSEIRKGLAKIFTTFPYRNMSLWIALSWEFGSDLFIAATFLVLLPVLHPHAVSEEQHHLLKTLAGWISFIGVFFYQGGALGAWLMSFKRKSVEATYFYKLTGDWFENPPSSKQMLSATLKTGLRKWIPFLKRGASEKDLEKGFRDQVVDRIPDDAASGRLGQDQTSTASFDQYPTWKALLRGHFRDIGFVANLIMFLGASLFLFNGICGLPMLMHGLLTPNLQNYLYWYPSDVASVMFLLASILLTIETQEKWYRPHFSNVGWWVGAWSIIGSIGFVLCSLFGPLGRSSLDLELQSLLASLWGALSFRISSTLMHYEAVNREVVEELWDEDDAEEFRKLADFLPFSGSRYQRCVEAEMERKAEERVAGEPGFRRNSWAV